MSTCTKRVKISIKLQGIIDEKICGKKAVYGNLCRHHARKGRFVVRDGEVGEILARFDTEAELRGNIHLYPNMQMQKITKSQRRTLYFT